MGERKYERQNIFIYGKNPVFFLLKSNPEKILKVFVTKNTKENFQNFIFQNSIKLNKNIIEIVDNNFLDKKLGANVIHQGYLLETREENKKSFFDFLEEVSKFKNNLPKIVILDQITDPHNVGAIIRSAAAFNIKYIFVTDRHSPKDSGVIYKSSVGMAELVEIIEIHNVNEAIKELKGIGYWVVGLDGSGEKEIKDIQKTNIALIIGSEGNGIRSLIKKNCDFLVKIPMNNNVESLNASVAAGIVFYQINT